MAFIAPGIPLHHDRGTAEFFGKGVGSVENAALPVECRVEGLAAEFRIVLESVEIGEGVAYEGRVVEGIF